MLTAESECDVLGDDEDGIRQYLAFANDPINNVDPTGLLPEKVVNYLSRLSTESTNPHFRDLATQALTLEGQINAQSSAGAYANASALFQQQVGILKQIGVSGSNAWDWAQEVAKESIAPSAPVEPPEGTLREHGPLLLEYRNHQWVTINQENSAKAVRVASEMYAKEYAINAATLVIGEGIGFIGGRILEGLGLGADAVGEAGVALRQGTSLSGDASALSGDTAVTVSSAVSAGADVSTVLGRQIGYGTSDLSKAAQAYKQTAAITAGRNVAVFEYRGVDGSLQTIARASERGVGHAERIVAKELGAMGVQPSQVTRIYSELQPCNMPGGYCDPFIRQTFPQADVTWSFEYGATAESRAAGVDALRKAAENSGH